MRTKTILLFKIFETFSVLSSFVFVFAHIIKRSYVSVYIKELNQEVLLRPWTGDFATLRQVIWDKEYDFKLEGVDSIVDLGANIGISTIKLAKKYPTAQIIALEPEKNNFSLLQVNTKGLNNISILNSAAWYKDGSVEILNSNVLSNGYKFKNSFSSVNKTRALTIPSIMKMFNLKNIDLLKIDIEGAEEEIFAIGNLEWLNSVKCIIIEIHSTSFYPKILNIMTNLFESFNIGEKVLFIRKS